MALRWKRPRKLNVLLLCPMWSPLSECCHIRSCWSGPARGQKAEIGAEMKPTISLSSILGHWLSWLGGRGGPFPKLHNSTLGPVLVILDGFPVPTLLFSRKEKQGGQISLKSTFHKLKSHICFCPIVQNTRHLATAREAAKCDLYFGLLWIAEIQE